MKTASTEPHTVEVFPATTRKGAQNSIRETSSFLLHARYDCALSPTPVSTKSHRVMSQQACRKVSETLLSGPASTALLQLAQLGCVPCAVVNPEQGEFMTNHQPDWESLVGLTRLAWDPQSLIMTGITWPSQHEDCNSCSQEFANRSPVPGSFPLTILAACSGSQTISPKTSPAGEASWRSCLSMPTHFHQLQQ